MRKRSYFLMLFYNEGKTNKIDLEAAMHIYRRPNRQGQLRNTHIHDIGPCGANFPDRAQFDVRTKTSWQGLRYRQRGRLAAQGTELATLHGPWAMQSRVQGMR